MEGLNELKIFRNEALRHPSHVTTFRGRKIKHLLWGHIVAAPLQVAQLVFVSGIIVYYPRRQQNHADKTPKHKITQ